MRIVKFSMAMGLILLSGIMGASEPMTLSSNSYVLSNVVISSAQNVSNSSYVSMGNSAQVKNINSKEIEIFTIATDLQALDTELLLMDLYDQGLINKFKRYYILKEESGKIVTLRGDQEREEIKIRLVLDKYWPENLSGYIRYRHPHENDRELSMLLAGVSPNEVLWKVLTEGEILLKAQAQAAITRGVNSGPKVFIQGKELKELNLNGIMSELGQGIIATDPLNKELNLYISYDTDQKPFTSDKINYIKLTKPETSEFSQQLSINKLPFALIKKDDQLPLGWLLSNGFVAQGEYFVKEGWGSVKLLSERKRMAKRLDVFVMSYCPFSNAALKELLPLSNTVSINIHYIMQENDHNSAMVAEGFRSLYGRAEVEENIRQICIRRMNPDKYLIYLKKRLQDYPSGYWELAAEEAGISINELIVQTNTEYGEMLTKSDLFLVKQLQIKNAPSFLWENQYLIDNVAGLKRFEEFREMDIDQITGVCRG